MKVTKLSAKRELFARALAKNAGDKVQAYRDAGFSTNMTHAKISTEADKVANYPNVSLRVKELQKVEMSIYIASKQDKLKILEDVIEACKRMDEEKGMINAPSVIAALKEHNAMQGDNAPIKTTNTNIEMSHEEWLDSLE